MAEILADLLPKLRKAKGFSQPDLSHATARNGTPISSNTIASYEAVAGRGRVPEAHIIEALAKALDVEPARFYEWPLAEARREARPDTARRAASRVAKETAKKSAARPHGKRPASPSSRPAQGEGDA